MIIHSGLSFAATIWLFIQPFAIQEDQTGELSWAVTLKLVSMIGVPFVVLSATSPLIQAWHSLTHPGQKTYRFYALSNLGSLVALVSYPFLVDPWIDVSIQFYGWTLAFFVFLFAIVASGLQVGRSDSWTGADKLDENPQPKTRVGSSTPLFWFALAATGSVLLIATSNILCQEVASFPFLWVLPLIVYLLTLIICFDWPGLYVRSLVQPIFAASCFLAIVVYHFGTNLSLLNQSIGCCTALFFGCMVCHGELVRLRPGSDRLTSFYLAISFGGAVGSILAVVVAPRIFTRFFEFHYALILSAVLSLTLYCWESLQASRSNMRRFYAFLLVTGLAIVPVASSLYFYLDPSMNRGIIFQGRNDYGLVSVQETENYRIMKSGSTNHGGQFLAPEQSDQPFAYYSEGSGAQVAFAAARSLASVQDVCLNVGVIGLGTGSLLSYGEEDDHFRFYEINPMVMDVANEFFDYLPSENAEVVLGDGRLNLTREFERAGSNQFDLLFLDAFTSDSIPVHLLTQECFELYLNHLSDDGVIVAHITNKFVDLTPVLASIVESRNLYSARIEHSNHELNVKTVWILLTRNARILEGIGPEESRQQWVHNADKIEWTDDSNSVFPIVNWRRPNR